MKSLVICSLTEYCAGGKIEKNEMGGACDAYGAGERGVQGLVGKPKGKRTLGRPRRRWEDNIKMDLQEVGGLWGLDGVDSGQGQVAGTCEYGDEPSGSKNAGNFLTGCRTS